MSPSSVSVIIPPPAIDLDSYEPFDEEYARTVDEILSDEASFDASFDSYAVNDTMDGACDDPKGGRGRVSRRIPRQTKSPYFSTGQLGRRRSRTERHITRIDIEDEDEADPIPPTDAADDMADHENTHNTDNTSNVDVDDVTEEDIVFASVGPETRDRLLEFFASHPFMREGAYPVRRSARRTFVREVHAEAKSAGMDEEGIAGLELYVKKTYLELYGNGPVDTDGSEYGDEVDDEEERRESLKLPKKERKRKRANGEKAREKSKKSKKESLVEMDPPESAQSQNHVEREAIDLVTEDPLEDVFISTTAEPQVVEESPVAGGLNDGRRSSITSQSGHIPSRVQPSTSSNSTGKRNGKNSGSDSQEYPLHPAKLQREPISLDSDTDVVKLGPAPPAAPPKSHSPEPGSQEESIRRAKKERNRRKREARKQRKAQRHRESLRASEIAEIGATDSVPESEATAKKSPREHKNAVKNEQDDGMLGDPFWTLDF